MEVLRIQNNKKANGHCIDTSQYAGYIVDNSNGLYREDYFKELLSYERKRTERSRRPFLLMLLDINHLSYHFEKRKEIVNNIALVLFSSTRELDVKGWYKNDSVIGVLFTELNGIDKSSIREKTSNNLCKALGKELINNINISIHLFPDENNNQKPDDDSYTTLYPDITIRENSQKIALLLKRVVDVAGSIAGLIIFSPFFIIIPILIKLTSKGPIFFKQERIGRFGKKFSFLKFRSMYVNNDSWVHQEYINKFILQQSSYESKKADGPQCNVYKIKNDSRLTPIGNILRKTSLDELPQFFNVLRGEMSLVGPRPPVPYEVKIYDIWHRRRIMEVKPGITGLWQTKGRSSTTFDEMVRMDIEYIRGWSIWLDIKILLRTPWVVITGKGAY